MEISQGAFEWCDFILGAIGCRVFELERIAKLEKNFYIELDCREDEILDMLKDGDYEIGAMLYQELLEKLAEKLSNYDTFNPDLLRQEYKGQLSTINYDGEDYDTLEALVSKLKENA